jgi:hypothetical protein
VIEGTQTIQVVFADGATVSATVAGSDSANDVAVIKVDPTAHALVPATLGDSTSLRVGDPVVALGNPFELSGSLTQGIVSGLNRTYAESSQTTLTDLIQTDAAVNPGNSGGPAQLPGPGDRDQHSDREPDGPERQRRSCVRRIDQHGDAGAEHADRLARRPPTARLRPATAGLGPRAGSLRTLSSERAGAELWARPAQAS